MRKRRAIIYTAIAFVFALGLGVVILLRIVDGIELPWPFFHILVSRTLIDIPLPDDVKDKVFYVRGEDGTAQEFSRLTFDTRKSVHEISSSIRRYLIGKGGSSVPLRDPYVGDLAPISYCIGSEAVTANLDDRQGTTSVQVYSSTDSACERLDGKKRVFK